MIGAAHSHRPGVGVDRGDVSGSSVRRGPGKTESLALSDGESVDALMLTELLTRIRIDHCPRPDTDVLAEESLRIP